MNMSVEVGKSEEVTECSASSYYLMKAEPDSRVVKGHDVKFSVDDFEAIQTTPWEGVRNYEARNIMQEMKVGDKVLFYHSNTKNPGVAGFAEVSREAYPDHTAWDEHHPYYDPKSDSQSPRWYMVDLRFLSRVTHFVSLALLRHLSSLSEVPEVMSYLDAEDLTAIKSMSLLNKGRLSVQRVDKRGWDAISKIAKEGDGGFFLNGATKTSTKIPRARGSADTDGGSATGNQGQRDTSKATGKRKAKVPAPRKSKRSRHSDRD